MRLSQFPGHSCFCPWVVLCMFYCYRGVAEVKSKDPEFLTKVERKARGKGGKSTKEMKK